jgi:hypothetical protein
LRKKKDCLFVGVAQKTDSTMKTMAMLSSRSMLALCFLLTTCALFGSSSASYTVVTTIQGDVLETIDQSTGQYGVYDCTADETIVYGLVVTEAPTPVPTLDPTPQPTAQPTDAPTKVSKLKQFEIADSRTLITHRLHPFLLLRTESHRLAHSSAYCKSNKSSRHPVNFVQLGL